MHKRNSLSGSVIIAPIIVVALIISGIFFLKPKSKSAPVVSLPPAGTPLLSFALEPAEVAPASDFDLIVQVNPNGAEFHAFELYFNFDSGQVELRNSVDTKQNISSQHPLIRSDIDATGKVTMIGTRLGDSFSGNANVEIGRVRLKSRNSTLGSSVFKWNSASKIGQNIPKELLDK